MILPKKWILKWDKQILSCSIGTICAFLFVEVIPSTIHQIGTKFTAWNLDEGPTSCIYFGLVILFGMILAGSLELLETDHAHHLEADVVNADPNKQSAKSCCDTPSAARAIIFATIVHNLVDGIDCKKNLLSLMPLQNETDINLFPLND